MKKIEELFKIIEQSEDNSEYHDAIFELIDNYQDKRIIPYLFHILKSHTFEKMDGTLLWACYEYNIDECINYLDFLIEILINGNYEISMTSLTIISDLLKNGQIELDRKKQIQSKIKELHSDSANFEFISQLKESLSLFD